MNTPANTGALLDAGKQSTARAADDLSEALRDGASTLGEHGRDSLAEAASAAASQLARLSDSLRQQSIDELMHEARVMARRNPALFVMGGLGVGLALSRFLKSSAHDGPAASVAPAGPVEPYRHADGYERTAAGATLGSVPHPGRS
jgi:hypothetical protein